MKISDIVIKPELRCCEVDGKLGYFHCWERYRDILAPGLIAGSHPDIQYYRVLGIVEFSDGVERVDPSRIKFNDEKNCTLRMMQKEWDKLKSKHWIDNADSYICPICGEEVRSPSAYPGCKCPKCGFQNEKDKE